jgi:arylesterase / paraoxonase
LTLDKFPANTDKVWHGLDILEVSPGNLLIYAINHRRTGSVIEKFHYTVGTTSLVYEKTFDCNNQHIFTPNDVAVIAEDEFYVTNVMFLFLTGLIVGSCCC